MNRTEWKNRGPTGPTSRTRQMIDAIQSGKTLEEVGEIFGISKQAVYQAAMYHDREDRQAPIQDEVCAWVEQCGKHILRESEVDAGLGISNPRSWAHRVAIQTLRKMGWVRLRRSEKLLVSPDTWKKLRKILGEDLQAVLRSPVRRAQYFPGCPGFPLC